LLGERLLVFRLPNGAFGCLPEHCPHRGASLYYGFVEDDCLRCAYHGWAFASDGRCVERPFETKPPAAIHDTRGYVIEELGGILFAYLGPRKTITPLPRWDILARTDGARYVEVQEDLRCNWLQVQENAVDVTHTFFLHSEMLRRLGKKDRSGFGRGLRQYGFQPFPWGILKSWEYEGAEGKGWGNPLVFPNALRIETEMHWRIPLDDRTTRIFWVGFKPGAKPTKRIPTKRQPRRTRDSGDYTLVTFMSQDAMAWETQGEIFNRANERLGASDIGITVFRRMLAKAIRDLDSGTQLPATVRKEDASSVIDLREWMGGYLPMSCAPDLTPRRQRPEHDVFDGRHRIVRLPTQSS
jgi:5,5'-dehydrodivanillate O-demethylase